MLDRGAMSHLSKLGKIKPGYEINLTRTLRTITDRLSPEAEPFPQTLPARDQALFALGYHHQSSEFFRSKTDDADTEPATDEDNA